MDKIKNFVTGVLALIIGIAILWLIGKFIIWSCKWVWNELTKPAPICYYEYIDAHGNTGTSSDCYFPAIKEGMYCAEGDSIHLVTDVKKVCK